MVSLESPALQLRHGVPDLPSAPLPNTFDEKPSSGSADKLEPDDGSSKYVTDSTMLVNGEPVVQSGVDVSNFVVDDRDDGDPALTFRSFFLGTVIAGLGAALAQVEADDDSSLHTSTEYRFYRFTYSSRRPSLSQGFFSCSSFTR